MTKNPHIKYAAIKTYVLPEDKPAIVAHAKKVYGLSVSSYLRMLLERDMQQKLGVSEQIPDGTSKRRK